MEKRQKNEYKKNILFLTIHFIFSKRITGPVMMLLYQAFGLNYSQIGSLSAITTLSDASLEVYGGAFSDVYGRKKCSLLYASLAMTNMAVFAFGHSFLHFAIGNAIYGATIAVGSGNSEALLFDTLSSLNEKNKYKKYRGQMQFAAKVLNGLIILGLPFLYLKNIKFPFYLGLGLYSISFITALLLKEPPRSKTKKRPSILKTAINSLGEISSNNQVAFFIAFQAIWTGFILLFFEYFQPVIKLAGVPLAYFGIIYAFARLFEGLGSALIHKFERHSNKRLLYINILMLICALFGFAFTHNFLLLVFIMIGCLADGIADVVQSEILNNRISSINRTTIISTANVANGLFASIALFAFGHISNRLGVQEMFGLAGISFLVLLAFFAIFFTRLRTIR